MAEELKFANHLPTFQRLANDIYAAKIFYSTKNNAQLINALKNIISEAVGVDKKNELAEILKKIRELEEQNEKVECIYRFVKTPDMQSFVLQKKDEIREKLYDVLLILNKFCAEKKLTIDQVEYTHIPPEHAIRERVA